MILIIILLVVSVFILALSLASAIEELKKGALPSDDYEVETDQF